MKIKHLSVLKAYLLDIATKNRTSLGVRPSEFYVRAILVLLLSATALGLVFLSYAQTDEVVSATGSLTPVGKVRTVQMPQGGVIDKLLVSDGDFVKKDQALVVLDGEVSSEVLKATKESVQAKSAEIHHSREEFNEYLRGNRLEQAYLSKSIKINESILKRFRRLSKTGAIAEIQVLQQEVTVEREKSSLKKLLAERDQETAKSKQRIERLNSELQQLISRLAEIEYLKKNTVIRSQISGIIFDLKPKGSSFVGQGTEPLMKIVPEGELHALVYVGSDKIGFVRSGQDAEISIDSYPSSDFGTLKGRILRIGSSSLEPNEEYPYFRYPVIINLLAQKLKRSNQVSLPLKAGMSINANIKLRKVSYLQLLLSDFKDKADSLREI